MITIYQVDAFTDIPFAGNPAGVCILDGPANEEWMQNVAKEMAISETAFLYPENDGYDLRWFAPDAEVDLCGHATLASAHILWEKGFAGEDETLRFFTKSGLLTATFNDGWVELDFPALTEEETDAPVGLTEALGVKTLYTGKNAFDYLVEVASEEELRSIKPDLPKLAEITARGINVTAISSSKEYDFISRLFAPAIGIPEDPVTGSAHCCLGPYWAKKLNKTVFTAYQASERGGFLKVQVKGERVLISGKAVTVIEGKILGQ
ncbi:PhzF family phenazine biosynthesis protein [Methanolobus sediminis]|uniref:PhzF family phenazine biosynthesis protein n=1 Tax=Methanolobus sediminis TaxID=3072978 RepID=A0AA51UKM1_9EURY|nr:PhzF family phenazine biosynthesis protein [Methanolobus sediminis]WMW24061.1 PhzF family phenazine biosynthesis protein [Methanolobus sediminis]